jgi:hypothetical protein
VYSCWKDKVSVGKGFKPTNRKLASPELDRQDACPSIAG